jgi:hypothetical protein
MTRPHSLCSGEHRGRQIVIKYPALWTVKTKVPRATYGQHNQGDTAAYPLSDVIALSYFRQLIAGSGMIGFVFPLGSACSSEVCRR